MLGSKSLRKLWSLVKSPQTRAVGQWDQEQSTRSFQCQGHLPTSSSTICPPRYSMSLIDSKGQSALVVNFPPNSRGSQWLASLPAKDWNSSQLQLTITSPTSRLSLMTLSLEPMDSSHLWPEQWEVRVQETSPKTWWCTCDLSPGPTPPKQYVCSSCKGLITSPD